MYELFKKHKTKILIIIAAVAVLTAAFFMGESPNNSVQIENSTSSNSAVSEISKNENTNKSDISVLSSTESSLVSSESKQKEQSTVSNNNSETSKDSTVNSTSVNENTSTAPIEHSTYTEQPVTENSTQKPNKNENTSNNSSALNSTDNKPNTSNKPDTSTVIKENSIASPSQTPTEQNTCTISISCATILDNMDKLDSSKKSLVSSDGCILDETTVTFQDGDSVFDVLKQTCTDRKIHLEFSKTPLYNSYYVEGINNIYEFDCGSASGWLYRVNGTYNSYSSSEYKVENGDKIEWLYSCNLGKDIDGYFEE